MKIGEMSEFARKELLFGQVDYRGGRILLCDAETQLEAEIRRRYDSEKIVSVQLSDLCQENNTLSMQGSFSVIIIGRVLEQVDDPHRLVMLFTQHLSARGILVAVIANIRYWKNWRELIEGHWRYMGEGVRKIGVRHCFSREELVDLLQKAGYKDFCFNACISRGPEELLQKLRTIGAVDDQNDLETEFWIVRATPLQDFTLALRQSYTPELRQIMVCLLRRIETGIDIEENCHQFWKLCGTYEVTAEYLLPLIENTMLQPKMVLQRLSEHTDGGLQDG